MSLQNATPKTALKACFEQPLDGKAPPEFRPKVVIVLRGGEVTFAGSNTNVEVIVHNADLHPHEEGDALLGEATKGCVECDVTPSDAADDESEL